MGMSTTTCDNDGFDSLYAESFQFSISDYRIEHQGRAVFDATLQYIYKPDLGNPDLYFDFQQVISCIDKFFVTYPNETDYWEILNKNLPSARHRHIDQSFGFADLSLNAIT